MDRKLLRSNIAWLSRYELVHETFRLFCYKTGSKLLGRTLFPPAELELVKGLLSEKGNKVVYRCTGEEVRIRLVDLGMLAYRLLELYERSAEESYATGAKLFKEQFEVSDQKTVIPKPKEPMAADSIQSPHDTDCHYRNKDGNQIKGYSVKVTESCDKQGLNLISNMEVKKADAADNGFLEMLSRPGSYAVIPWKKYILTGLTTVRPIRNLSGRKKQNLFSMRFRDRKADMILD